MAIEPGKFCFTGNDEFKVDLAHHTLGYITRKNVVLLLELYDGSGSVQGGTGQYLVVLGQ